MDEVSDSNLTANHVIEELFAVHNHMLTARSRVIVWHHNDNKYLRVLGQAVHEVSGPSIAPTNISTPFSKWLSAGAEAFLPIG